MRYEGNIFRPFSEALSYILQCTIGCSHNSCTFCGMYRDKKYRVRGLDEIKQDIGMAAEAFPGVEKVFLCDGDAIAIDTVTLLEILSELKKAFPRLRHVASYVGPSSTLSKTPGELRELRDAGLVKAYLGVESGSGEVLEKIRKGVDRPMMLEAGLRLIGSGMNLSVMVLLGIAGTGGDSERHALETARICDEMKPHYLAGLTVTPVPGTPLYRDIVSGKFSLPDPFGTLEEMKLMIEGITSDGIKFVGTHASNYLPITGRLQQDKKKMIETIESVLRERNPELIRGENMRGL